MHNKSKLAREIIEAERHPPHRKPPAKPREKIVEEAGQHLRTLHSQAPSGTREWNIASVDYRLQSLDRQTLGKIRERNIAAANAHFAFPLSFAGPYSGVGDEEVTDYDIASVFGEESNPVSVGKALAQGAEYAEKSDQGKVTSIFTEAQAPKVIRFDHAAVNAALMAAAKKRRHAQKHREAERRRAEKCPDDEPDVMTLMEGHPAKEETPDRLGFSVDEPDTIAMAEERLVEEPVDNDKADEQPLSPPPTLPFLKGPKKRRDAPMSRAEEAEAVTLAYAGDKEAQRKLVSCNEGLVRKKAGEFFANYQGFTFAELVEVGRCTIFDVIEARSYKPEKGYRFNTYAGRAVQNALWKYVNAPVADVGKTNPKEGPEPSTTAWPKNPAVKRKRRKPGKQEPKPGAPMSAEKVEALVDAFLAKGNTIKTIPPRAHKKRAGRIRPDLKGYISIPTERSRPVEDIGERLDLIMAQEHREGRS